MGRCDRCGATFFGDYDVGESAVETYGTACPLCLLERLPSDSDTGVTEDVVTMARTALAFATMGEIRRRIVELADGEAAGERTGPLRTEELRSVTRALDTSDRSLEDLTNRELRDVIAERVGVDVTPASSFRKDELVEILVSLLRPSENRGDDAAN